MREIYLLYLNLTFHYQYTCAHHYTSVLLVSILGVTYVCTIAIRCRLATTNTSTVCRMLTIVGGNLCGGRCRTVSKGSWWIWRCRRRTLLRFRFEKHFAFCLKLYTEKRKTNEKKQIVNKKLNEYNLKNKKHKQILKNWQKKQRQKI